MDCSRPLIASELFRVLLKLQRSYALCEARLRHRLDLNDTDLRAVNLLRSMQTPSSGELARELGVSSAGITSVLDRLEARGVVERRHHAADRRRTLVAPGRNFPVSTGPGQVLLRNLHKFYAQLDEPDRRKLGALLEEVRRELETRETGTGEENQANPTKSFQ
ncbi:MarR family transcriptional regulator [Glutamicibacter sp.]|uniref:MarR family transcriptional regulator n=1 Tax=Glutamicibacter sp. TaxID=1931995 RepID=UPI003D6A4D64